MSPILQGLANGSVRGYGGYLPLGPSGAFESIASANGTGSSRTITFSSIPSTYQSLQIRASYLTATDGDEMLMTINGNTGSVYARHYLSGDGANAYALGFASQTSILAQLASTSSTHPTALIIDIQDYASTTRNKTVRIMTGCDKNGSGEITLISALFNSTAAISSLTFATSSFNLTTSTRFSLYGIKA